MNQAVDTINVVTEGAGLIDITSQVRSFVANNQVQTGLLTVFCRHTSVSLVIQENADPDVLRDLQAFFRKIVPEGAGYRHEDEGPDDMPAHIRTALTQTSLSIPIVNGRMVLGTWQAIYLLEHRAIPHQREVGAASDGLSFVDCLVSSTRGAIDLDIMAYVVLGAERIPPVCAAESKLADHAIIADCRRVGLSAKIESTNGGEAGVWRDGRILVVGEMITT